MRAPETAVDDFVGKVAGLGEGERADEAGVGVGGDGAAAVLWEGS